MAGGSLVAHRCGHLFRRLYICMSNDDKDDNSIKCPEEFVDWAACMQHLSEERRLQMRSHLLEPKEKGES
ncbi:CHCH domain protein [Cooperia oncophora]